MENLGLREEKPQMVAVDTLSIGKMFQHDGKTFMVVEKTQEGITAQEMGIKNGFQTQGASEIKLPPETEVEIEQLY